MVVNIDVTLRDGGYRTGFNFPSGYPVLHARMSVQAGFDWVEIGYRNGSFNPTSSTGMTGASTDEYISEIAEAVTPEHVAIILHPKNVSRRDFEDSYAAGARLVRICLAEDRVDETFDLARYAKSIGFTVGVNVTRASRIHRDRLRRYADHAADAGADVLYIADSNGSMTPAMVARTVSEVRESHPGLALGFHAHNNLGFALTNAVEALDAGAGWMDSSLLGMGKGAGNLISEQWIAYLTANELASASDLAGTLQLAHHLSNNVDASSPSLPQIDLMLALFDLSVEHKNQLDPHYTMRRNLEIAEAIADARS